MAISKIERSSSWRDTYDSAGKASIHELQDKHLKL